MKAYKTEQLVFLNCNFLFDGISTFVGYIMTNLLLQKNICGKI